MKRSLGPRTIAYPPPVFLVDPLVYSTGDSAYFGIGERLGDAYSVGKDEG